MQFFCIFFIRNEFLQKILFFSNLYTQTKIFVLYFEKIFKKDDYFPVKIYILPKCLARVNILLIF